MATNRDFNEHIEEGRRKTAGSGYVRSQHADEGLGCCGSCLVVFSWVLTILFFPIAICMGLKIIQEYERAIVFRLGRALPKPQGPGMSFMLPCVDTMMKVDLRTVSFDVPAQEILTKDSVTVAVDAVVYFRIADPLISVVNVEEAPRSTKLLAQTTLQTTLGMKTLSQILSERDDISAQMKQALDSATNPWGVKVERVEIKDVRLPHKMQRSMAAEAEATREARAKVIAAEGEQQASRALKDAADVINESPCALQLRYLQTVSTIATEKNSTIVFPIPIDILKGMGK